MSDYTEIVARVRGYAQCIEREHFAEAVPTGMALTSTRLIDYAADLRALCVIVDALTAENERLERERDQAIADEKLAVANADRMTDEVIRLTAENERLREDGVRVRKCVDRMRGAALNADWHNFDEQFDAAMRPTTGGTDA